MATRRLLFLSISATWLFGGALAMAADIIDFEKLAEGTPLGTVTTPTNAVTFGVGPSGPSLDAYVAGVGLPMTAFNPNDTPSSPNHAGERFLTDEPRGPSVGYDYFMKFAKPVGFLSLDLYDFRVDGGPAIGDSVTLNLYSDDSFRNVVGHTSYTITGKEMDQNVLTLRVAIPCLTARSARLAFSHTDIGTGIDNITFDTVVETNTPPQRGNDSPCVVSNRESVSLRALRAG